MNKRDPIKHIRDKAKSAYVKGTECYICRVEDELQFHHYYSLTPLFTKWCKSKKIIINTDQDVIDIRDMFIKEHHNEIYKETVTLCTICHNKKLHRIYGKSPILSTAKKQKRWVGIQREKHCKTI